MDGKFALVSFGNEEAYGLLYAGTELKKHGEIRYFDTEFDDPIDAIVDYDPDYLCFSPMTTFYPHAKKVEDAVKERIDVTSIYGGHHATNCGEPLGDITCVGNVMGLDLKRRGIINGGITRSEDLKIPTRYEYYRDIPRMRDRYRKIMMSVVGCPFHCTYCSSKHGKELMGHRDMNDVLNEANFIKDSTHEIEWVDDDVFAGDIDWLMDFFSIWNRHYKIPMYVSATSKSILEADSKLLELMRKSVNCVGMGIQAIRPSTLKLMGRSWDSEAMQKDAYDRLISYGYRVNLQAIVGLPIDDPIEDAIETIDGMTRIGKGCIASVYPLQIYPNTAMKRYCENHGFEINDIEGDTSSGLPGINFGRVMNNRIRNICKLATMVIKYGISMDWLRAMLDIEIGLSSSALSKVRYYECVKDRLPQKAELVFDGIERTTHVRH